MTDGLPQKPMDERLVNLGLAGLFATQLLVSKLAKRGLLSPSDITELWGAMNHALQSNEKADALFSQIVEDHLEKGFARARVIAQEKWQG